MVKQSLVSWESIDAAAKQSVKIHVANARKSSTNQDSFTLRNIQESSIFSGNLPPMLHLHFLPSELPAHPSINQILYSLSKIINYTSFFFFLTCFFFFFFYKSKYEETADHFRWRGAYLLWRCARLWITKRGQNTQSHLFVLFHFQGGTFSSPLPRHVGWETGEKQQERESVCVCEGVGGLIKSPASRAAHEAVSSALDPFLTPRILRRQMRVGGGASLCTAGTRAAASFIPLNR